MFIEQTGIEEGRRTFWFRDIRTFGDSWFLFFLFENRTSELILNRRGTNSQRAQTFIEFG